jgi:aryl-alcohol dehydrogenase-like predicted oxidoreductase
LTERWGKNSSSGELSAAFQASLDAGIDFFDTAEIYAAGRSERELGRSAKEDGRPAVLASKFAPLPMRLTTSQFMRALDRTLSRLGRDTVDLYYLHFPYSAVGLKPWMAGMAKAAKAGKIRAVGVSNCSASQMRQAAKLLAPHDLVLAANQVRYSLVHRQPERDGVLDACRELDVALVAYRPLEGAWSDSRTGSKHSALGAALADVATGHTATSRQVALRWLLQRDDHIIAIPGTTKAAHARENAEALSLALTDDEFDAIDRASSAA